MDMTHRRIYPMRPGWTGVLLMAALLGSQTFGITPSEVLNRPDRLTHPVAIEVTKQPHYPQMLVHDGVLKGYATFVISVDDSGNLEDYLMVEASEEEFGRSIENVIEDWEFTSAYFEGEYVPAVQAVRFDFRDTDTLVTLNGFTAVKVFFRDRFEKSEEIDFRTYKLNELDFVPEPVEVVKPEISKDLSPKHERVHARYHLYIDPTGRVRVPVLKVIDGEIDEITLVLMENALKQWRFEPPQVNGKPVLSVAEQPVTFTVASND